jgi:hemerythrin-like metal-binding protein
MFSFNWKSRYSVGVKELDLQHQAIMDGLNELHEEMMNGNQKDAVERSINNLVSLAGEHFAAEELLMASAGFPGLADHRAKHKALSRKVEEFIARHEKGDVAAYSQFMYFVRDWFTKHMENEDREYVPWLAEHGIR